MRRSKREIFVLPSVTTRPRRAFGYIRWFLDVAGDSGILAERLRAMQLVPSPRTPLVAKTEEVTRLILFYLDSTSSYIHVLRGMRTARYSSGLFSGALLR